MLSLGNPSSSLQALSNIRHPQNLDILVETSALAKHGVKPRLDCDRDLAHPRLHGKEHFGRRVSQICQEPDQRKSAWVVLSGVNAPGPNIKRGETALPLSKMNRFVTDWHNDETSNV